MSVIFDVVSCFMFDAEGRLLLLQRHRDDWGGGLWATPAGKMESSETQETAMLREVQEETGITLPSVDLLGTHLVTMPHSSVYLTSFVARLTKPTKVILRADEHEAFEWFPLESLLERPKIIWATPTILRDFKLMPHFETDPTLADGSTAILVIN